MENHRSDASTSKDTNDNNGDNDNCSPRPEIRTPHPHDVLCGLGGRDDIHPGNVRFRALVDAHKRTYLDPRTKKVEKARIAARIVSDVRALDPPGRFLREDPHTGMWVEIGDERAWKKAGQALRESAPEIRAERQQVSPLSPLLARSQPAELLDPPEEDPSPQHQVLSFDICRSSPVAWQTTGHWQHEP